MEKEEICCSEFNPNVWNEKVQVWQDKAFVRETIPQFLHMPLPGTYGKAVTKMMTAIESAHAKPEEPDYLTLAEDPSPWKSNLYISTTGPVEGLENVPLSGTFHSKVFEGPYQDVPKYMREMENYVTSKGGRAENYFFYYTYCPKCAKKYGHNYIVVFARTA